MKYLFLAWIAIIGINLPAELLYQMDFSRKMPESWQLIPQAKVLEQPGNSRLSINVPAEECRNAPRHAVSTLFDLTALKNRPLRLTVECRAFDVTRPEKNWNGVKFMLHYLKDGRDVWRSPSGLWGSFNWRTLEIAFIVPEGVEGGKLMLGLEECSGSVEFRNLRIEAGEIADIFPPQQLPPDFRAAYSEKFRAEPRRRGAMSPPALRPGDLEELAAWNADLIRWQLVRDWGKQNTDRDAGEYLRWIDRKISELDRVMEMAELLGLKVIIDLHSPPGGRTPELAMLHEKQYLETFLTAWETIARRMKDKPALWAYDLVNEPLQAQPAPTDYLTAQKLAAEAIRKIDPATPIIVESNDWCSPRSYSYLTPLPLENIIYQIHMYWLGGYTHQGVNHQWGIAGKENPLSYPNEKYHKEALREHLQPVREFQQKYGARIYVGEFAAVRWAPGAEQYLDDCISLFEEYGWDWTYHAFREWSGWSVEHSEDPQNNERVSNDTKRKKILLKYFERNRQ